MKRSLFAVLPLAGLLLAVTAGTAAAHDTRLNGVGAPSGANLTSLPLGDGRFSTETYEKGSIYLCSGSAPSTTKDTISAPWINSSAGTFNLITKATYAVDGAVSWASQAQFSAPTLSGTSRTFSSNDLPSSHTTGVFPIASTDNAHQYDGNPNSISAQSVSGSLKATPQLRDEPQCVGGGAIAITTTGVVLFNALDADGRDALANEIGDSCDGHPNGGGMYHYHLISACISDEGSDHSNLVGYAMDGFGLYGYRGESGAELTNDDLDECHGHTHAIEWDGETMELYHYHATREYPYTISCFRGTSSVVSGQSRGEQSGQQGQRGGQGATSGQSGQTAPTGTPQSGAQQSGGQGGPAGQGTPPSGAQPGGPSGQSGQRGQSTPTRGGQTGGQTGGQQPGGTSGAPSGTQPSGTPPSGQGAPSGQQSGGQPGGAGGTGSGPSGSAPGGGGAGQTGPGAPSGGTRP